MNDTPEIADITRARQIHTIRSSADDLRRKLTDDLRTQIISLIRSGNTHEQTADRVLKDLKLPEKMRSAVELLVFNVVHETLPEEEIGRLRQSAFSRNLRKAHESGKVDYAEHGKKGGIQRAQSFALQGTPSGSLLWNDEEKKVVRALLDDRNNYYVAGAHAGKPNFPHILAKLHALLPQSSHRTLIALRLMVYGPDRKKGKGK